MTTAPLDDCSTPANEAPTVTAAPEHGRRRVALLGLIALIVAGGALAGFVLVRRTGPNQGTELDAALGVLHPRVRTDDGTDPHEAAARDLSTSMFAAFTPPAGAALISDSAPFDGPALQTTDQDQIDHHKAWHVPGDAATLANELYERPPKGLRSSGFGSSFADGANTFEVTMVPTGSTDQGFSAQITDGVTGSLQCSLVDSGHGQVVLRVDAVTSWTRSRTPGDQVPADVVSLALGHMPGMNDGGPARHRSVSDHQAIAEVVHLLDSLQPIPRGVTRSCGMDDGQHFTLSFTKVGQRQSVATATAEVGGCRTVTIAVEGHRSRSYNGTDELLNELTKLDP